jgi:hypothetical protein
MIDCTFTTNLSRNAFDISIWRSLMTFPSTPIPINLSTPDFTLSGVSSQMIEFSRVYQTDRPPLFFVETTGNPHKMYSLEVKLAPSISDRHNPTLLSFIFTIT